MITELFTSTSGTKSLVNFGQLMVLQKADLRADHLLVDPRVERRLVDPKVEHRLVDLTAELPPVDQKLVDP